MIKQIIPIILPALNFNREHSSALVLQNRILGARAMRYEKPDFLRAIIIFLVTLLEGQRYKIPCVF